MAQRNFDETNVRGFCRVWVDYTVDVNLPQAQLYAFLRDIDAWPSWTPGLRGLQRKPNGSFVMRLQLGKLPFDLRLPCELFTDEPHCIEWGGGIPTSVIRHRFELSAIDAQHTQLRHVEYATNLLALVSYPLESWIRAHDRRWSNVIRARFAGQHVSSVSSASPPL